MSINQNMMEKFPPFFSFDSATLLYDQYNWYMHNTLFTLTERISWLKLFFSDSINQSIVYHQPSVYRLIFDKNGRTFVWVMSLQGGSIDTFQAIDLFFCCFLCSAIDINTILALKSIVK